MHAATRLAQLAIVLASSTSSSPAPSIEADNVVISIVGAGNRDGLYVNLGVELNELARAALQHEAWTAICPAYL